MKFSFDEKINRIAEKSTAGERLTFEEGMALFETEDMNALGKLADNERRRRHGKGTTAVGRINGKDRPSSHRQPWNRSFFFD